MTSTTSIALLALLFTVFILVARVVISYALASRRPDNFPPGPAGLPIIGNLHQIPQTKPYLKWHEWAREHGSIIGLKFGPQNVVILNNAKHVQELFDRRGALYNGRPKNHIGEDVITHLNAQILLADYGPEWRRLRKAVQGLLNANALEAVLPIQAAESTQLLADIVRDPGSTYYHIRRYSSAVVLASVYGQRGTTYDLPKVQALYHAQEQFTSILAAGAAPPVDIFPILKWVPLPWRAWALRIRDEQRTLYKALLDETKRLLARRQKSGRLNQETLLGRLLDPDAKHGLNEEQMLYTGGTLMEAGSDTTSSTLHSWCIAMTERSDVLAKCQEELDRVCGTRMPTANDTNDMPYLRATMNETLRWRPVAPSGIPHKLVQDDTYEGYVLPKGTLLFANTWSIHRDEQDYEDASNFKPERWLENPSNGTRAGSTTAQAEKESAAASSGGRRATYSFGAGRRVCPGQGMAENSLMLVMARLAWAFDLSADKEQQPVSAIETGYSDGFITGPFSFKMNIEPRSDAHKKAIEEAFEQSKPFLESLEE